MEITIASARDTADSDYITISLHSKSKVISFKIDELTLYLFDKLASQLGVTRSYLLREIVKILSAAGNHMKLNNIEKIVINISVYNGTGEAYSVSAVLMGDNIYIEK